MLKKYENVSTRDVVGWERAGTAFSHLFALLTSLEDLDHIKTWLRSNRCARDTQIRTASQKSTVKQEDPVWKFL